MSLHCRISLAVFLLLSLTALSVSGEECERLKSTLSYTQETAPRDLSRVVSDIDIQLAKYIAYLRVSVAHIFGTQSSQWWLNGSIRNLKVFLMWKSNGLVVICTGKSETT